MYRTPRWRRSGGSCGARDSCRPALPTRVQWLYWMLSLPTYLSRLHEPAHAGRTHETRRGSAARFDDTSVTGEEKNVGRPAFAGPSELGHLSGWLALRLDVDYRIRRKCPLTFRHGEHRVQVNGLQPIPGLGREH